LEIETKIKKLPKKARDYLTKELLYVPHLYIDKNLKRKVLYKKDKNGNRNSL